MNRVKELKRRAIRMKLIGTVALIVGLFLIYQWAHYSSRDFYTENFERFQEEMSEIQLHTEAQKHLDTAMHLMQNEQYWEATTALESVKHSQTEATQIAEWYKILCMIGLEEKKTALALIDYYLEQENFPFNRDKALKLREEY